MFIGKTEKPSENVGGSCAECESDKHRAHKYVCRPLGKWSQLKSSKGQSGLVENFEWLALEFEKRWQP